MMSERPISRESVSMAGLSTAPGSPRLRAAPWRHRPGTGASPHTRSRCLPGSRDRMECTARTRRRRWHRWRPRPRSARRWWAPVWAWWEIPSDAAGRREQHNLTKNNQPCARRITPLWQELRSHVLLLLPLCWPRRRWRWRTPRRFRSCSTRSTPSRVTWRMPHRTDRRPSTSPTTMGRIRRRRRRCWTCWARSGVRATFFLIERHITDETAPIVRRMADEGHGIALHSHTRAKMLMPPENLADRLTSFAARVAGPDRPSRRAGVPAARRVAQCADARGTAADRLPDDRLGLHAVGLRSVPRALGPHRAAAGTPRLARRHRRHSRWPPRQPSRRPAIRDRRHTPSSRAAKKGFSSAESVARA